MAGLGTNHVTLTEASSSARTRSNSAFIRELWTDEIIATYKSNLVMPQLVVTMPFVGKKGDTVHIPKPVRGTPSAKVAEQQVTLIANQESTAQYLIDQHWEYSRLIEDIVAVQADDNLRGFYTDDAGYALAKLVDTRLHAEGAKLAGADAAPTVAGSSYSKAVVGTPSSGALVAWDPDADIGGTNDGNGSVLTDEGIRLAIRAMDDNDVPGRGRVLVIPPVEKKNLLGLSRFTEQAFVGSGESIRNGMVGNVYGVEVYVSTNCATVTATDTTTDYRAALLFQKEAFVFIEQMRPRVQTQYKQEWLGDLFTSDVIFGTGVLRPEAGIAIIVPS